MYLHGGWVTEPGHLTNLAYIDGHVRPVNDQHDRFTDEGYIFYNTRLNKPYWEYGIDPAH